MSQDNGYQYSTQWTSMRRREIPAHSPKSDAQFEAMVTKSLARRQKLFTDELQQQQQLYYRNKPYCSRCVFTWLNSANPQRARRRVQELYWQGWKEVTYAFLLTGTGTLLFILGLLVCLYSSQLARGVTLMLMSLLLCIPGYYSAFILIMYIHCKRGYSYKHLVIDWD